MRLTPTFLEKYCATSEPFALLDGRLFLIQETTERQKYPYKYVFLSTSYSLRESRTLVELEKKFFDVNSQTIEDYLIDEVEKKYVQKINGSRERRRSLKEMINEKEEALKEDKVRFLVRSFYNAFLKNVDQDLNPDKTSDKKISYKPDLGKLSAVNSSILISQLHLENLLGFPDNIFYLNRVNSVSGINHHLVYRNSKYRADFFSKTKTLINTYRTALQDTIDKLVNEQQGPLKELYEKEARREKFYQQESKKKKNLPNVHGQVSYRSSGSNIRFYIHIPPFIVKKGGRYYKGSQTASKIQGTIEGNKIKFSGYPHTSAGYDNPFVYSDGKICHGTVDFSDLGYVPGKFYNIFNPATGQIISQTLKKSRVVLESGWRGNPTLANPGFPEHYFTSDNSEMHRYRRSKGIPEERVFDPDKR